MSAHEKAASGGTNTQAAQENAHANFTTDQKRLTTIIAQMALAGQINTTHYQAIAHADKAIGFAKQAGDLLMQVKADLPHGEFLPWVENNLDVTPRQAQRYMAAAQGKPTPIRKLASKATPVSYLPDIEIAIGSVGLVEWQDAQGNKLMFEIHAFMFPDGVTFGYRSAYLVCDKNERFGAFSEYDRRGMNAKYFSVRDHAGRWDVPLENLTVHEDCEPYLWTFMHDWDVLESMRNDWVKADLTREVQHDLHS